ncbi:DUF4143 domain-containing protein [Corynebacterium pyruviciproducens]|uniref:DUF4143 domain-containing protein n=1 Tax=Corynebacterium pyruviciproducens TaxID=598660 RepID=UPI001FE0894F|nr:DUF4143 domain-containing protein [Corynebacterium pyruviciproducens]
MDLSTPQQWISPDLSSGFLHSGLEKSWLRWDTKGREEIDAVVELCDGRWLGFEVKLSHHAIDGAAAHLKAAAAKVVPEAAALLVIVPTGPAFRRADGVWVVPLVALAP